MKTSRTKMLENLSEKELVDWLEQLIIVRLALRQASTLNGENLAADLDTNILVFETVGVVRLGKALKAEFNYEKDLTNDTVTDLTGCLSFQYKGFKVFTYTYESDDVEELLKNE